MSEKKTKFLIRPVGEMSEEEERYLDAFAHYWETPDYKLHYPPRDINQEDPRGLLYVCLGNRDAMRKAESAILFYKPANPDVFFDLGMAFAANKPLSVINPDAFGKEGLSLLERFIVAYAESGFIKREIPGLDDYPGVAEAQVLNDYYDQMNLENRKEHLEVIKRSLLVQYEWKGNTPEFLFDFGMAFMQEKALLLKNKPYIESQRTMKKGSFQDVLLELDRAYDSDR